jgi:signal transduction histidine kinase
MKAIDFYFKLFNFLAAKRIKCNDLDLRRIHSHTVITLSTGILMWGYAFLALYTIASPVPGIIGLICSTIHLLSPLLFRLSNNAFLISNIMIGAGMIHQSSFSYFSDGFDSHILIWFGILPMLGGIIAGKRGAVLWASLTTLVASVFLFLEVSGFPFPAMMTPAGRMLAHAFLVFGWIFLSSSIIYVLLILNENKERLLTEQSQKIEDLFRVLFHDLAGPLSRISIGLSIARREHNQEAKTNGLEIAAKAADSMMEITQNVRRMYSVSKGRLTNDLIYFALNDCVDYVQRLYANELEKKNLKIDYDFQRYNGLKFLVGPVSFKNQVLGNALSNAIKFSQPSSKITIRAYPYNHQYHAIEIVDTGIGIPKNLIDSLFDMSKKTSRPGTSGENGTGYGMHIMKSFIEMYQGKISVESKDDSQGNSGTTIKILLKAQWDGEKASEIEERPMAPLQNQATD